MDIYEKFFGKPTRDFKPQTLSLLKEDNENGGIFIAKNVVPELKSAGLLNPTFIAHTKKLIDNMHAKLPFASEPNEGFENGMSVTWCRFKDGNLRNPLCIPNISGMAELINSYRHSKIVVNVDFEGLLKQIEQHSNPE